MKEFKGTPGPWNGKDVGICRQGAAGLRLGFIITSNESRVHECSANSHLIATSPELLAALQQLLEIYDDNSGKVWTTSSKRRALDNARAAVNKALGE